MFGVEMTRTWLSPRQKSGVWLGVALTTGGVLMMTWIVSWPEQVETVRTAVVAGPCHLILTLLLPWPVMIVPLRDGMIDHWKPPGGNGPLAM